MPLIFWRYDGAFSRVGAAGPAGVPEGLPGILGLLASASSESELAGGLSTTESSDGRTQLGNMAEEVPTRGVAGVADGPGTGAGVEGTA